MQYTIETRNLTTEQSHRPLLDRMLSTTVEAATADDAINKFVRDSACELVSFARPLRGAESFATIRKNDFVFLVRVYAG